MRLLALTALFLLSLNGTSLAEVGTQSINEKHTEAKQALVLDYQTGQVLLAKNADQHMPTSSMSKVMTSYMIFEALKNGTLKMGTKLKVSEKAWRKGGSKMFVEEGKKIKVEDLLRGVIIQSGNDATIVLAEGLSGSEKVFSRDMTAKALEIGMENSNFVNASGWPDPNHYSTAYDLALMTKRMIEDFPEYYSLFAEKEFTYSNIKQQNRNPLLYRNIGADGLKTGHTDIGGYGLIGTAVTNDRRVVVVINGLESEKARADESVRLIEWGLNAFTNMNIASAKQVITEAPVARGQQDTVELILDKAIKVTMPISAKNTFNVDIKYKTPLLAPIKQGQEVGTLTLNIPNMESKSYPLFAGQSVEPLGFLQNTIAKMKTFFLRVL